jgi:hypothetical protein
MDGMIKINKISNPELRKKEGDSRNLPKMPRLYLELIENKDKIKQSMINKEYDADDAASDITFFDGKKSSSHAFADNLSDVDEEEEDEDELSEATVDKRDNVSEEEEDDEDDEEEDEEDEEDDEDAIVSKPIHTLKTENEEEDDDEEDEEDEEEEDDEEEDEEDEEDEDEEDEDEEDEDEEDEEREGRVETIAAVAPQKMSKSQKYAKILNESMPPKLSELEEKGEINTRKTIPNLDRIYHTEDEEDELKRELLFKFELLRKSYKMNDIPDFNIHSDLKQMSRSYESTLRRVSLDSCVENYKQLLIGAFMVLEFILGYLFKFDMQGFTQQQIVNMTQYERLLIELGENSYVPGGSQWPVEVRLLIMVLGNAAIFIIAKMIMKKTGSNLMGMMNSFSHSSSSGGGGGGGNASKRKMRGPSINPDDIPDIGV